MCDVYIRAFEAAMELEASQRPLAMRFRALSSTMGSPFSFTRMAALRKAIELLVELSAQSATTDSGEVCDVIGQCYGPRHVLEKPPTVAWDRLQQALGGANLTSAVFHRIVPRRDLVFQPGAVMVCDMTQEEALQWTTLVVPRKPPVPGVAAPVQPPQAPRLPDDGSSSFFDALRAVTLVEQELAFRFVQGACMAVPRQKEYIAESPLLHMFAETMLCFKQHMDALRTVQLRSELSRGSGARRSSGAVANAGVINVPPQPLLSAEGVGIAASDSNDYSLTATLISRGSSSLQSSVALSSGSAPPSVCVEPALESVIAALVDAVEAACHYHPRALVVLVSSGGLKAAMAVALCPYAPQDIRCAILDMLSLLLQEVSPFRRLVAAPIEGEGSDVSTLSCMLDVARGCVSPTSGQFIGRGGGGGGGAQQRFPQALDESAAVLATANAASMPFTMDRASASKLDSAVRDVLSQRRLLGILPQLFKLRDVQGTRLSLAMPRPEVHRLLHKGQREREKLLSDLLKHMDELQASDDTSPPI